MSLSRANIQEFTFLHILQHMRLTVAGEGESPNPEVGLTAKAVATHDVIVSGTVSTTSARPSGLK